MLPSSAASLLATVFVKLTFDSAPRWGTVEDQSDDSALLRPLGLCMARLYDIGIAVGRVPNRRFALTLRFRRDWQDIRQTPLEESANFPCGVSQ